MKNKIFPKLKNKKDNNFDNKMILKMGDLYIL